MKPLSESAVTHYSGKSHVKAEAKQFGNLM